MLQSENGILGVGPYPLDGEEDPDLINAGKGRDGHARRLLLLVRRESFAMIRGGHVDLAILGALEVSERGDRELARSRPLRMGGGMDLVAGATGCRDDGSRDEGSPEDPAGVRAPSRPPLRLGDLLDRAWLDATKDGLVLRELAPGETVDSSGRSPTGLIVAPT